MLPSLINARHALPRSLCCTIDAIRQLSHRKTVPDRQRMAGDTREVADGSTEEEITGTAVPGKQSIDHFPHSEKPNACM